MLYVVPILAGPLLIQQQPQLFWGFVASMYVGNAVLLILNLPLVGLFVNLLRIPYAYLYPLIIMFCVIGVYEVNHSIVDVWIMLIMGGIGYVLRKFDYDLAPIAWLMAAGVLSLILGLVINQQRTNTTHREVIDRHEDRAVRDLVRAIHPGPMT